MRQSEIAAVIERDMLRADDGKKHNAIECFACGRGMTLATKAKRRKSRFSLAVRR